MFPANTNILVIDDMKVMRMLSKKVLKELGFTNITEADNGKVAWNEIEQHIASANPFRLVLSDWNMPVMTGYELLCKIRSDSRTSSLPIIMITAESEKDQIVSAIKAGVNSYLVKPFLADTLKAKLEEVWKRVESK